MKTAVAVLLMLLLLSCHHSPVPEEQEQLDLYLKEIHHTEIKGFQRLFVVVISGRCGSCTEKTISFLKQLDKGDRYRDYKRIIIIPDNNAYVVDSFQQSSSRFIVDKSYVLEKYGINFPKNIFMEFRNDRLIFKDWLYMENVDSVARRYHFNL